MAQKELLVGIACCLALSTVALPNRPQYVECVDSRECPRPECCAIGMGRFSIPVCKPAPDLGQPCRPQSSPVSTSVYYPDGSQVNLTNVFYHACPCGFGLTCNEDSATCQDPMTLDPNWIRFGSMSPKRIRVKVRRPSSTRIPNSDLLD